MGIIFFFFIWMMILNNSKFVFEYKLLFATHINYILLLKKINIFICLHYITIIYLLKFLN